MNTKDLFRRTEMLLKGYKVLIAEVANIKIAIEELNKEYQGCKAITYEERTGTTNKFNSIVENELIIKENLNRELVNKQMMVQRIKNSLDVLSEREYEIIDLKYFKKIKSWNKIGERLDLTGEYCRSLNADIINKLSKIIFIEKYI